MELSDVLPLLPLSLAREIRGAAVGLAVAELRLRRGRRASLSVYQGGALRNLSLSYALSGAEIEGVFQALCGDSVYTHEDTLRQGYLRLRGGCRVGVGGVAVTEKGRLLRLWEVGSLVLRFHRRQTGAAGGLLSLFREEGACRKSILVYGPSGTGKTTLLREFAREISRGEGGLRTALLDARGEFGAFEEDCLLDILEGYPTGDGVEIAVRTLSPQVLVLDEIGKEEAASLFYAVGCGVPLVASAHGGSVEELCQRRGLGELIEAGVFPLFYPAHGGGQRTEGERVEYEGDRVPFAFGSDAIHGVEPRPAAAAPLAVT